MTIPLKYRPLLSGDAARLIGVSRDHVRKMVQRGDLEPSCVSCGSYIFTFGDLARWARTNGRTLAPIDVLDDKALL